MNDNMIGKKKPKKTKKSNKIISTEDTMEIVGIAKSLFKSEYEEETKGLVVEMKEQKTKISNLVYGLFIATFLVILTIFMDSHFVKTSYNQHYLDAEKSFSEQINSLRKENSDMKVILLREMDKSINKKTVSE